MSKTRKENQSLEEEAVLEDAKTPEEALELNHQTFKEQLADELLEQVIACSPEFFERLVVDLVVGMGYGGSLKEAGQATKQSRDGGIDGIIKEDLLGLDTIYIQAKKWALDKSISRPEIQKFAGALQGFRAKKGIFITTCSFSSEAQDYAHSIDSKIVLIDGKQLAQHMIDCNIGVSLYHSYDLKKLDSDYFNED